jgi:chorismate dehydratase
MNLPTRQTIRIGAVNYLNTRPLVYGLPELLPRAQISFDLPSRLADGLANGRLDVALIPSIEFFQQPGYSIVSNACIGCRGPVLSVKLFFRRRPEEVRTLALDEGSRTSAVLARILLHERFQLSPRLEPLPIGSTLADTTADAVLLIGDRAIHSPPGPFVEVWDLGDEWCRWSELPFVFAMWVARPGALLEGVDAALAEARDQGQRHLEDIACVEAAPLGLSRPECVAYLRDNLHFYLGARELAGLKLYYQLAQSLALAPPGVEIGCSHLQSA